MKKERYIAECYLDIFKSLILEIELNIQYAKQEIIFYKELLNKKLEEEPLKIRKKKHVFWEKEKKDLENKILEYQKELEKSYDDLDKIFIEQNIKN